MNDFSEMRRGVQTLLRELTHGTAAAGGYVLNGGDPGLLSALDRISAAEASAIPAGRTSSIAAHVEHLCYGLGLLNRWADGEEPFRDADYSASWRETTVTDASWETRRGRLRELLAVWDANLDRISLSSDLFMNGVIASVAHLAYHVGAIRQISPLVAGPRAAD
jgi:hypothetical protein